MDIPLEATGFDLKADDYEEGRPGYPPSAVSFLGAALGLRPGARVLDLAAGTGKLTRQLLGFGPDVVAVEPVPSMRRVLSQVVPGITVLEGTAESLPLPDASVDAITVAQAFHWFRADEALAEAHRVLRPGGGLALVWNVRDLSQPLQAAIEKVMLRYRGSAPSQASGQWKRAFAGNSSFSALDERTFPMEQVLTPRQLVARVLSTSFIACLPVAEQDRVAGEVASLVPPGQAEVTLAYSTDVYYCRRLG